MNRAWSLAAGLTLLVSAGCKSSNGPMTTDGPGPGPTADAAPGQEMGTGAGIITRARVVAALGACTLDTYKGFAPAADELAASAAALASDGSPARWSAARTAFAAAMDRWQEAEVHQYGPLGPHTNSPGGQDLRLYIYYWPPSVRCFVEQELVSGSFMKPEFSKAPITQRGLAAAEYLLHYEGTDNECAQTVAINAMGTWAALAADPAELARRKRQYAAVVTADVATRARALVDAWDPAKGNFLGEVQNAGAGSRTYASAQAALNAQALAMLYIDNPAKDYKLARPLGLRECAAPCLTELELRFARRGKAAVARNLDAFEKLLLGCAAGGAGADAGAEALGIDDLLTAMGPDGVALLGRLRAGIADMRAALAAITGDDLQQPLMDSPALVKALHDANKALLDVFKTELYTVLNIELPAGLPTDTD